MILNERKGAFCFDTNVIISALLFETSKPAQAFRYALQHGEILLSLEVLEELNEVLGREKFDRYLTREEREEFLETLIRFRICKFSRQTNFCRTLQKPKEIIFIATE
jgi:uncharacterized protein